MAPGSGNAARDAQALREALDEALADLPGEERAGASGTVDDRWLHVGLRLGLERPDLARHLLTLIQEQGADREPDQQPDQQPDRQAPVRTGPGAVARAGAPALTGAGDPAQVPSRSLLLARAAAIPPSDQARLGPEATFGWAAMLTPAEILSIGRTVVGMLAAGSLPDLGRGFGLAWGTGVRLPHGVVRGMFREFVELELTVASVLEGRDLRVVDPPARSRRSGGFLDALLPRKDPRELEAAATLDRTGEPARRAMVALWNVWMAMRYRTVMPPETFELLVRPWVTIVGPLPEP